MSTLAGRIETNDTPAVESEPAALSVRNLTVSYNSKAVLRSVTFDLPARNVLGVIGPNGAGKSTLLKAILGLTTVDSGEIEVFGRSARAGKRSIAYVPQTEQVDWDFPVTVYDVVMMGRYRQMGLFGRPRHSDRMNVEQSLERVGMTAFKDRHIRQLSGGQQQRVFIARALCQESEILLLDEPFAGVDARTEHAIFELMLKLSDDGKTLIVVNHDLTVLDRFDRLLMLNQRVVAYGPTVEVNTEDNLRRTYGGRLFMLDRADAALTESRINDDPNVAHSTRV